MKIFINFFNKIILILVLIKYLIIFNIIFRNNFFLNIYKIKNFFTYKLI